MGRDWRLSPEASRARQRHAQGRTHGRSCQRSVRSCITAHYCEARIERARRHGLPGGAHPRRQDSRNARLLLRPVRYRRLLFIARESFLGPHQNLVEAHLLQCLIVAWISFRFLELEVGWEEKQALEFLVSSLQPSEGIFVLAHQEVGSCE